MITQISALNWIGVLVAFAAYFLLGALWFTLFFKKPYLRSLGKENEPPNNSPIFIVGPAICTLVITLCSAILMNSLQIQYYGQAIVYSLTVGIGFLVANTVNIAINPNIPSPLFYGIVSGSYHLVGITLAGVILVAFK